MKLLNVFVLAVFCGLWATGCRVAKLDSEPVEAVRPAAAAKPKSEMAKTASVNRALIGDYNVTGKTPSGSGYGGTLKIVNQEAVYQFLWNTDGDYDGIGVQRDDTIAVAFGGKGCGVVNYRVAAGNELEGVWGKWGNNVTGTEKAVLSKGGALAGEYNVTGVDLNNREYKGKLTIKPTGDFYKFTWDTNGPYVGVGIRQGNFLAVSYGGDNCGVMAYKMWPDGTMEGKWGYSGDRLPGNEKDVRAR